MQSDPTHYILLQEGGEWMPVPPGGVGDLVPYALRFPDGREWDRVNGWRPGSPQTPLRVDIGCGTRKREGFLGMDRRQFPGVDIVHDISDYPWPFGDGSVAEVYCSHVLEHLDHNRHNPERCRFANELYRILAPDGFAEIITPHWASSRAYGDFTHADKPVTEFFFHYLSRSWRKENAPDNDIEWNKDGFNCDFVVEWGPTLDPPIVLRNQEFQQFAARYYREACQDLVSTWKPIK